ncbi:hypothetical protein B0H19DRAFT_1055271 [Mycena capillaripes]|nr:hypothetical protein B0H19DRAFT_1055271 [Mycena capillaripes]
MMHTHLSPLSDFLHNALIDLIFSADESVADAVVQKVFSPHLQESDVATSAATTRAKYTKLVQGIRAQFTDRKLVSDTYVLATPADPTNRTGALAATHVLSALQDGRPVIVKLVGVIRVEWVHEDGHEHRGRREVVTEATLLNVSPSRKSIPGTYLQKSPVTLAAEA